MPKRPLALGHLSPAMREAEYSPSSAIGGNYAPFIEQYRAESVRAHGLVPARRDLRYAEGDGSLLDFFPAPPSAKPPGLLVFIHGGYWQEGSKDISAFLAPAWHAEGFAHAVIGYPLAPKAALPEIVRCCRQAVQWLAAHAADHGFDPENMVIAGSSAGGYLTAACGAVRPGAPRVRGIVPISGVFDVAPLIGTSINEALGLDASTAAELNLFDDEARYPSAVVAWGSVETAEFKRQSQAFAAMLASSGTPCGTLEVSGRNHFDVVFELADRGSALFERTRRLFAS